VKPFDTEALLQRAGSFRLVSLGRAHPNRRLGIDGAGDVFGFRQIDASVTRIGIQDLWIHNYGSQDDLMKDNGLHPEGIADAVRRALSLSNER